MCPRLTGPMIRILALLCAFAVAPLVFFSTNLPDLDPPSPETKGVLEKSSGSVKNLTRDMAVMGGGLRREATRLVFENMRIRGHGSRGNASGGQNSGIELTDTSSTTITGKSSEPSNETETKRVNGVQRPPPPESNSKLRRMEEMMIMAKAYLMFIPTNSNSHLARELKLRLKESERVLAQATKDSDLSRSAFQKMRSMEATLSRANKAYPDCSAMVSKLRAMTHISEDQLRAQRDQASYLVQLASRTFPRGLHCLQMQLTTEYFALDPQERGFPDKPKSEMADLYHYVILSDNVLATAVAVNSTVYTSMEPEKIVFHVITDSLNAPSMKMWFLMNKPGRATIQIEKFEDFKWMPSDYGSSLKRGGLRDARHVSELNHLRFFLPDIFPYLDKVLFLDHDVVVQRDLRPLWNVDMKGKVNGAVELCRGEKSYRLETVLNFSDPSIASRFDSDSCIWGFGMNIFDLKEWRRRGLTELYQDWLQLGKRRQLWKVGSLPLGQITFHNQTMLLEQSWHALGLGVDSSLDTDEVDRAAVVHYSGNMKPWLDIAIPKYKGYWSKFLDYNNPYLQQCNIHD